MGDALTAALDGYAGDPDIRVVISEGGRARVFRSPLFYQRSPSTWPDPYALLGASGPTTRLQCKGFFDKLGLSARAIQNQ